MTAPYRDDEAVLRERVAELEAQEAELGTQLEALRRETDEVKSSARAAHPWMRGLFSLRGFVFLVLALVLGVEIGGYIRANRNLSPTCLGD